jgi:hypothetical protein
MGGRTEVDVSALRAAADSVTQAADALSEIRWPTVPSDAMPGSAVSRSGAPDRFATRAGALAATLRAWAAQARGTADAFERTEHGNAGRLGR